MVELSCVDIATEVSILYLYIALPQEGNLEAALHVMGYLRHNHNTRLIFDPTYPDIVASDFPCHDWMEFYGDVCEAILPEMPEPLIKEVDLRIYVTAA
jgi:hypothetical protein